jgi:hypothetical protein
MNALLKNGMAIDGPIDSRNPGEQFIRVSVQSEDDLGFINRKVGFIPVKPEKFEGAFKALVEGKKTVQFGSQNSRSGAYNVSINDPALAVAEQPVGNETTLTHQA